MKRLAAADPFLKRDPAREEDFDFRDDLARMPFEVPERFLFREDFDREDRRFEEPFAPRKTRRVLSTAGVCWLMPC